MYMIPSTLLKKFTKQWTGLPVFSTQNLYHISSNGRLKSQLLLGHISRECISQAWYLQLSLNISYIEIVMIYLGDTVIFLSSSSRLPLLNCWIVLSGHPIPWKESLRAKGTSMMISLSVGFFSFFTMFKYSRPTDPMYPATYRNPIVGICTKREVRRPTSWDYHYLRIVTAFWFSYCWASHKHCKVCVPLIVDERRVAQTSWKTALQDTNQRENGLCFVHCRRRVNFRIRFISSLDSESNKVMR